MIKDTHKTTIGKILDFKPITKPSIPVNHIRPKQYGQLFCIISCCVLCFYSYSSETPPQTILEWTLQKVLEKGPQTALAKLSNQALQYKNKKNPFHLFASFTQSKDTLYPNSTLEHPRQLNHISIMSPTFGIKFDNIPTPFQFGFSSEKQQSDSINALFPQIRLSKLFIGGYLPILGSLSWGSTKLAEQIHLLEIQKSQQNLIQVYQDETMEVMELLLSWYYLDESQLNKDEEMEKKILELKIEEFFSSIELTKIKTMEWYPKMELKSHIKAEWEKNPELLQNSITLEQLALTRTAFKKAQLPQLELNFDIYSVGLGGIKQAQSFQNLNYSIALMFHWSWENNIKKSHYHEQLINWGQYKRKLEKKIASWRTQQLEFFLERKMAPRGKYAFHRYQLYLTKLQNLWPIEGIVVHE